MRELKQKTGRDSVEGILCDFESLKSVRECAVAYEKKGYPLHWCADLLTALTHLRVIIAA